MTTGADFYNSWNFPFAMAFVAALIGCSMYEKIGFKKFAALVVGALGVGVVLVLIQQPTPNLLANLGIPLLFVALFAVIYRLVRVLAKKRRSLRLFGRSLLHFAIIVTLIGVFVSSTTQQASGEILATPNTPVGTLGLTIELKNFTVHKGTGNVHSIEIGACVPEYSALSMDVLIKEGNSVYYGTLWIRLYTINYRIMSTPLIISTLSGDLYIHMHHTNSMYTSLLNALMYREVQPTDLILTVEKIPLVYLVWAGVILMSLGMAIPLIKEILRRPAKK